MKYTSEDGALFCNDIIEFSVKTDCARTILANRNRLT